MKKILNKKTPILLTLLIIVTTILIVLTSINFYRSLKNEEINVTNNKIYGTVLENGENYIKIKSLDGATFMIYTSEKLSIGDFIVAYFSEDDVDFKGNSNIEIIANASEILIDANEDDTVPTSGDITNSTSSQEITSTTEKVSTTKKSTKTTSPSSISSDDTEIVSYFSSEYDTVSTYSNDQSFKEKAKNKFITFVDFIFYDGEIKGKKFNELTAASKAKVIYYTLLLDAKIDSKWPDYKKNIGNKYNDIKARLVAKYMEITTSICENNQDNCANVKNDFAILKKSIGLTWDVVKKAFSYAYNNGKDKLVKWYEVFSGKV